MSQPKRYNLALPQITYGMEESKDGEFVYHSDYAAIAAELERMRSEHEVGFSSVVLKKLAADYAALAAENERLKSELDFYKQATRFETWDGQSWTAHYQIVNNGKPQGTK